ncbi:MAG TPA: exodeoxyribonuclease VII small subunit [Candidatus Saccharimonadales bacterium]
MPKEKQDYQTMQTALDAVLAALQRPDVQVDEAVKLYEEGLKLIKQLGEHLEQAENTLEKLRLQTPKA